MSNESLSTLELERCLKQAFPIANQGSPLTHEECVELRSMLIGIRSSDFQCALVQVLLDLVRTHSGRAGASLNAEEVVRFFDVHADSSSLEALESYDPKREKETDRLLENAKIESLASLNPDQSRTIADWLVVAKNWGDLAWYKDEVESAIAYWSKRAAEGESS